MILVDTSVWIDHLRHGDPRLGELLDAAAVWTHPFVIGEIALGNLRRRRDVLGLLGNLPRAAVASDTEVLLFIEQFTLSGLGIGYVDAHLLASARLGPGTQVWTRDKRLAQATDALGLLFVA